MEARDAEAGPLPGGHWSAGCVSTGNRAKLSLAPALGGWYCYHLCLIARNRSSERFSTLPKATQPYLESQVSPGICQTPGVCLSPCSVPCIHACPFPGQGHCLSPASWGWPSQLSKALQENHLQVARGHEPGSVLSASHMLTRDNEHLAPSVVPGPGRPLTVRPSFSAPAHQRLLRGPRPHGEEGEAPGACSLLKARSHRTKMSVRPAPPKPDKAASGDADVCSFTGWRPGTFGLPGTEPGQGDRGVGGRRCPPRRPRETFVPAEE